MKLISVISILIILLEFSYADITAEESLNDINDLEGILPDDLEQPNDFFVDDEIEEDNEPFETFELDDFNELDDDDNVVQYENEPATYRSSNIEPEINTPMNWTHYQQLNVIYNWIFEQAKLFQKIRPNGIEVIKIGDSYEQRPILGLHITWSKSRARKAILIESNIHAIEWISSAATTCFFTKLMNRESLELRRLLYYYNWIFIPVMNPDGFWYSKNVQRLWRKNRKPTGFSNSSGICYGTDLNRNFDYEWNAAGYNIDVPCDHWYGGPSAASEPEVKSLVNFINSLPNGYIRASFSVHSYGNLILLPFGHSNTAKPKNYDQMMKLSKAFADAAAVKYGTVFKYGTSGELLYPVSGAVKDWAYGEKNIPFTATLELRDNGTYGFFLPEKQIIEVCNEITDGFIGFIKEAVKQRLFR